MKIINVMFPLCVALLVSACGGSGSTSTPVAASSSSPVSSVALSSSQPSSVTDVASSVATESSIDTGSSTGVSSSAVASSVVASLYPDYNTTPLAADATGMESTAVQIASKIKLGFNFGNTMEAIGGETAWGNPEITAAQVKLVKDSGFDAIRLPVAWDQYANQETAAISADWLDRVKQVVQYAVANELYVIVNIHWDGGWLENNVTPERQEANNAKQKAFWEQIATHLRDIDEHLLFASGNEPNVDNAEQMAVLDSYHQTFVDAVRATGGKNANRVLILQGPKTDIEETDKLWNGMPDDSVANKLMAEVHFYTPFNFTLMDKDESWGKQAYYWGDGFHSTTDTERNATWGEEALVDELFAAMQTRFVDQGIPVVLGEFGAMRRDNLTGDALSLHLASRAYYLRYVTERASSTGLLPFVWDTGSLFNRSTVAIADQQALDALLQGAGKTNSSSSSHSSAPSSSSAPSTPASSSSSAAASSVSNTLVFDIDSSLWEAGSGVVMSQTGNEIQLNLGAANQEVFYNIDGAINLVGATLTIVVNFDSDFVTAVSGGMAGILQFIAFERADWTSDYVCWTGWQALVAGQDISFSCSDFTKSNSQPSGVRMGIQFFGGTGTVTIKSATLKLAE